MEHRLLNTQEATTFLGVSKAFLERDRWAGAQIPFVRVGTRAVRYKLSELEAYVNGQMRRSTTDLGETCEAGSISAARRLRWA